MSRWPIIWAVFLLFSSSCISVSSFQSARTVRDGEWSGFGGVSSQNVEYTKSDESDLEKDIEKISVPLIEAGARWGVGEKLDIGFKYTTLSSLTGEIKYMLSDPATESTAHSIGLGITSASFEAGSGEDESEYSIIDFTVPYFFTYDFSKETGLHISPRYILRQTEYTDLQGDTENSSESYVGLSVGMNFTGFVVEVGAFRATGESDAFIRQVTVGYSGNWDVVNRGPITKKNGDVTPELDEAIERRDRLKRKKKRKKRKKKSEDDYDDYDEDETI